MSLKNHNLDDEEACLLAQDTNINDIVTGDIASSKQLMQKVQGLHDGIVEEIKNINAGQKTAFQVAKEEKERQLLAGFSVADDEEASEVTTIQSLRRNVNVESRSTLHDVGAGEPEKEAAAESQLKMEAEVKKLKRKKKMDPRYKAI